MSLSSILHSHTKSNLDSKYPNRATRITSVNNRTSNEYPYAINFWIQSRACSTILTLPDEQTLIIWLKMSSNSAIVSSLVHESCSTTGTGGNVSTSYWSSSEEVNFDSARVSSLEKSMHNLWIIAVWSLTFLTCSTPLYVVIKISHACFDVVTPAILSNTSLFNPLWMKNKTTLSFFIFSRWIDFSAAFNIFFK